MARIFDIIELPDEMAGDIVRRFPEQGSGDFRIGSQVIVRESQAAVFFRDGKALDVFGPGRHTITTANIPLLVNLIGKAFSGETPFKAEVYFVSTREFLDLKWGTPEPITIRDAVLRMARLRAFGTFAMQISEPQLFVNQIVGAQGLYRTADIERFLRSIIVTKLTDLLGELGRSILDIPAMVEELAAGVRAKAEPDFAARGLLLKSVYIESISPTEETARAIDQAAAMGAIGDMDAYLKYQAALGMREAAQRGGTGDLTGAGVGLGAGAAMGITMAQMMTQAMQKPAQTSESSAAPATPRTPQTAEEIQALLDNLDAQLASGAISEATYQKLYARWEAKLKELRGG
ncbi:MAG: SPFH domain-containing protein [Anaerolineae bacterium]|nr:SPFH domain-containing protein [Anaerolineae bacterium]MDW8067458.1 SPFH domain-containing protein [Anaerolineae bacterium]